MRVFSRKGIQGVKPLKICHLTSVHSPFDIRIFQKECKTIANSGYEVILIVPHQKNEQINGVRIQAVPKPHHRLARMIGTTWKVILMAWREKPHLCHIHDPELLLWAQILRLRKIRLLYDMHENTPKAILTKHWIPNFLKQIIFKLYKILERLLLINIPVVFAEESYPQDYQWVQKGVVIKNMPIVDQLCHINNSKYFATTAGYIGGVTQDRGSLVTLEAMRILKDQGVPISIEFIGPYDDQHGNELKNYVNKYQLDGVSLRGYMVAGEGYQRLSSCHVGLAILRPIPNYLESYPTKMFEYMALGLPVITSNFLLYREVVEKSRCGICIDPENPAQLASAIKWIVDHPGKAREMGLRGKAEVLRKYNWSSESKRLITFYEEVLA